MICVVVKGPSLEEVYVQISHALEFADLIELRLDYFERVEVEALKKLRALFSIPMIFSLRSKFQGGSYLGSEESRFEKIREIVSLQPEYLDLENSDPLSFINEICYNYPEIKLILSCHNYEETPQDLEGLYQRMQKIPAHYYKIAVVAQHCIDVMRLICWAKKSDNKLIAISMGSQGQISRILGPVIGSPIVFAALEDCKEEALGQLSSKTLRRRYCYSSLNPQTKIFALIGDPVDKSISDETHNKVFASLGLNAVYIKIQVSPDNLSTFLQLAKQLPFCGISVTMPLKEVILPYLDHVALHAIEIGAVNTLFFEEGKIYGFNTDGIGALNAVEKEVSVKGRKIVILGAGGAAKAIAYEAIQRGGLPTILNRDIEKSLQLSQRLNCIGKGLESISICVEEGYEILINCTSHPLPIHSDYLLPNTFVMDITTMPMNTLLLRHAKEKGCKVIYGHKMFVEQALGQFQFWFKNLNDFLEIRVILEKAVQLALTSDLLLSKQNGL
jgi:3-dehydroquinate dehydratase / shikimate dehydrogenase